MEYIQTLVTEINSVLWGVPMMILLMGTHLFFTIRLRFPQRKIFHAIKLSVTKDQSSKGDVSQFGALTTALAGTIGTGNIVGVATAVALGGPGAVLWCWLTGVLGISTKYAEALLAVKYRVKGENGKMIGGPMYALERGLKMKWLAILFCIFGTFAFIVMGNMVQTNSICVLAQNEYGIPNYITGLILATTVALVILFGIKGIARVSSILIPFMALFYFIGCIIILIINAEHLTHSLTLIVQSAFTPQAAGGGFLGSTILIASRYGIARGLFSNESGLGTAPIVAAAAKTKNPVRQALVSSSGTFWDTVVICALTGLVIVSSVVAYPEIDHTNGATLTQASFGKIPYIGSYILTSGLLFFSFSTILGYAYLAEKTLQYLFSHKIIPTFRVFWVIAVFGGSLISLNLVWDLADMFNALMAIPNLISLLLLSGVIISETKKYLWNNRLDEEMEQEEELF